MSAPGDTVGSEPKGGLPTSSIFGGGSEVFDNHETPSTHSEDFFSDVSSEDGDYQPESTDTIDWREFVPIDSDGDLLLLVGHNDHHNKTFLVSRKAVSLISRVWKTLLYGDFVEKTRDNIPLPDDNSEALEILLNIAHLRFKAVPSKVTFDRLFQLAIVCDKYEMTDLIERYASEWRLPYEYLALDIQHGCGSRWLTIAWVFQYGSIFDSIALRWLRSAITDPEADGEQELLDRDGTRLMEYTPIGILESIKRVRLEMIQNRLDHCYLFLDRLENNIVICQQLDASHDARLHCEALLLGTYQKALRKIGLWPKRRTADEIHYSIDSLKAELEGLRDSLLFLGGHPDCEQKSLPDFFSNVPDDIPSPLTAFHREHFG